MRTLRTSPAFWAGQIFVVALVALFVWRTLAVRWSEFRAIEFAFHPAPGWIALAGAVVIATYALLIEAWRRILAAWNQSLSYPDAVRIWTLSNLGRYLPGKVWSIAGLALLAQRRGVAGWAAGGSAVVMQAIAIGTGVALVAVTAPRAATPGALLVAAAAATATVAALLMPGTMRLLSRVAGGSTLQPLAPGGVLAACVAAAVSWVAYGFAFWCLARGLLGPAAAQLSVATAVGVFGAGYIVGLIALFAPGGLGVREVVFLGLLTGPLGAGGAVALAAASRVLLTLTEIAAALAGLALYRRDKEQGIA